MGSHCNKKKKNLLLNSTMSFKQGIPLLDAVNDDDGHEEDEDDFEPTFYTAKKASPFKTLCQKEVPDSHRHHCLVVPGTCSVCRSHTTVPGPFTPIGTGGQACIARRRR